MPGIAGVGFNPPAASWIIDRPITAASWIINRPIPNAMRIDPRPIPAAPRIDPRTHRRRVVIRDPPDPSPRRGSPRSVGSTIGYKRPHCAIMKSSC
jgi:hypothetical protein